MHVAFQEQCILTWQKIALRHYVEKYLGLCAKPFDFFYVLLEHVLPRNVLIVRKVVHLLEVEQFPELNLRFCPGPQHVPRVF